MRRENLLKIVVSAIGVLVLLAANIVPIEWLSKLTPIRVFGLVLIFVPWLPLLGIGAVELGGLKLEYERLQMLYVNTKKARDEMYEAYVYRLFNMHDEAIKHVERALDIDPQSEDALIELAVLKSFVTPESTGRSVELLEQVIRKNPKSARAHYNLACMRVLRGEPFGNDLRRAIEIQPKYREWAKRDTDFEPHKTSRDFLDAVDWHHPSLGGSAALRRGQ